MVLDNTFQRTLRNYENALVSEKQGQQWTAMRMVCLGAVVDGVARVPVEEGKRKHANEVYYTEPDGSGLGTALCCTAEVPWRYGIKVWMGHPPEDQQRWHIQRKAVVAELDAPTRLTGVGPHAVSHAFIGVGYDGSSSTGVAGEDPVILDDRSLFNVGLHPYDGLQAQITPGWLWFGSTRVWVPNTVLADQAANRPTTAHRGVYVLVEIASDLTVSYQVGTEFDVPLPAEDLYTYVPPVTAGRYGIAAIYLQKDQTAINHAHIWPVGQLRQVPAAAGGAAAAVDVTGPPGETLALLNYVYHKEADNKWYKVDIDDVPPLIGSLRGLVIATGTTVTVRLEGVVDGFTGLTAGQPHWAAGTPGGTTTSKPVVTAGGGQRVICRVGEAVSTTAVCVSHQYPLIFVKRESLADAGTLTVEHLADAEARSRKTSAYRLYSSGTTLRSSLIAWWSLDETGGTRVDAHGGNNLTDYNTVGYAAGKVSNAAALVRANSEYLYHTDNASLSTGDIDYTVQIWVYLDSKTGVESIISKDSTGSNCEYALYYNSSTDRFVFRVYSSSGVTIGEVTANALGSPALSTWYHILIWHDSVNNQVGVRINDTYQNTAATTGVPSDTTATFYVGANEGTNYWNGRIDETAFWKRLLTADEKTWLYNGGSGRAYGETDYAVGAHEELCVVGRWSGGTRDVAVCFDDGSGSNGDTRTTFKNVSGSTLDVTCSVEVD